MRRRLYMLLILNAVFILTAMSQQGNAEFLFEDYREATVYLADNSFAYEKVNYNVKDRELYYIDKSDGMARVISNIDRIRIIKTDDRNFIQVGGSLQEVLPTTPPIYIEYLPKVQAKASSVGYGMTSSITSTSANTYLGWRGYALSESQKQETMGFSNRYWIEKNGNKKRFTNFKQFLKIYSKHKNVLHEHIKANNIDFNDIEGMVNLCLYAESLNGISR